MNKFTYEKITNAFGETYILRSDNAIIPIDNLNVDYQEYLESLKKKEVG